MHELPVVESILEIATRHASKVKASRITELHRITGLFYLSAAVLIIFLFLLLIVLHFSVVISKLTDRNKDLAQRYALLELEFLEFKKSSSSPEAVS